MVASFSIIIENLGFVLSLLFLMLILVLIRGVFVSICEDDGKRALKNELTWINLSQIGTNGWIL